MDAHSLFTSRHSVSKFPARSSTVTSACSDAISPSSPACEMSHLSRISSRGRTRFPESELIKHCIEMLPV